MDTAKKPKIEAIFPLTNMQQGLLFHYLSASHDQGFLHVQCSLKGFLNTSLLEKAWEHTIKRHQVLRTTVHWKNIEKPVQLVHPEKSMNWRYLDWKTYSKEKKEEELSKLKATDREAGTDFEQGPLLNITLIEMEKDVFCLLWPCHHLLLDGWSSNNILKDVFAYYQAFSEDKAPVLEALPSYKSYLNWTKTHDSSEAREFWEKTFSGFGQANLFDKRESKTEIKDAISDEIQLSEEDTNKLYSLARQLKITPNSLIQGLWTLLLSRYFESEDITYGTTVSGRSANFPNIELLSGMFMNVQAVRILINGNDTVSGWLKTIQDQQQQARKHEHITMDEVMSWIDRPAALPLFDSLLIFENFPWEDSQGGELEISDFKSGLTSTYPLTLVVVPGKHTKFKLLTFSEIIKPSSVKWFLKELTTLLHALAADKDLTLEGLSQKAEAPQKEVLKEKKTRSAVSSKNYVAPRNKLELQLLEVWEDLFGARSIGIHDNFFEIGGKSLLAVKMFSVIEKKINIKLAPTTLLEHPTIASIAEFISKGEQEENSWKYLVPIRAGGSKTPLFCIHAGGGHVFFYNLLPSHLDAERPVYAVQPSGIDGREYAHTSIEEMTSDYLTEMKSIQHKGPYNIMVYCFSTAIGIEMVRQLEKLGEKANLIVIDTMAEQESLMTITRIKMRLLTLSKRMIKTPFKALGMMFTDRYNRYVKPLITTLFGNKYERDLQQLKANLVTIYKKYEWKDFNDQVSLILTEKDDPIMNREFIRSWKRLALKGVNTLYSEGSHRTLFEEPDVKFVGERIENCIEESR
ncbi:hypothetical protein GWK08_09560 [Leptobacterium flavescens]|uniref:Carrier domain-containing protein n=1 Tax=Leptobacterium flavescens TaxID=472055 RepID=A0A6P0UKD0_9FLAO|nr:condensation domain-containing protein [Leptobacterium flavescens]NER13684.1 hypothetical protein [Leptobacterium flavescens]